MSRPTASNTSQSSIPRKRGGFCASAAAGRSALGLEAFLTRGSRGGEDGRFERPAPTMTVFSSAGAAAAFAYGGCEASGKLASKSPPGMVGARSCAGAVAAHSRSERPSGAGGGAIGAGGVDGAGASLPPQLLQKLAPSRFSALHTGQIKAMTTDF